MSDSRPPKHRHYGRTSCGVCQLGGGVKPRRRLVAALTRVEQLEVDRDISQWNYDRWLRFDVDAGRWRWMEVDYS